MVGEQKKSRETTVRGTTGLPALARFLIEMPEEFTWTQNKQLIGINFKRKGDNWLLVVTAMVDGTKYVCFAERSTLIECLRIMWEYCHTNNAQWKQSRY